MIAFFSAMAVASFPSQEAQLERIWTLIDKRYIYQEVLHPSSGEDWNAVKTRSLAAIKQAKNTDEANEVIADMVSWLNDHHSVYLSPKATQGLHARYGNLACVTISAQNTPESPDRAVSSRLVGKVGVITIPDLIGFNRSSEVSNALNQLQQQGAQGFVLDLRNNPGGQALEMARIAGFFQSGILWKMRQRGYLLPLPVPAIGSANWKQPLAIVIDDGVNSAAEGLSGGLQAVGRAKVFGKTSAGNVEAVYPYCLPEDAMVFVATGQLAPWKGKTWENRGVVPDGVGDIHDAIDWITQQIKR